ncbi:hypothetical protein ACOSP7_023245 [Xanthoceras sorbifolium]
MDPEEIERRCARLSLNDEDGPVGVIEDSLQDRGMRNLNLFSMQSLGTSSGEGAVLSEVAASPFVFVAKELSSGKGSPKKGDVSEAGTALKTKKNIFIKIILNKINKYKRHQILISKNKKEYLLSSK